jgi:hypothetical protein
MGDLQHQESEHEPCDEVDTESVVELLGSLGVRVDDTAAGEQDRGIAHPESAIGREC